MHFDRLAPRRPPAAAAAPPAQGLAVVATPGHRFHCPGKCGAILCAKVKPTKTARGWPKVSCS
eukprot:5271100-Alexandrium_andersonii.AAC.1